MNRGSLYGPARHPALAKEIQGTSPSAARESTSRLDESWRKGSRKQRVLLVQAANQEANRAKVESTNPRVSTQKQTEAREISMIYRRWVDEHKGREGPKG